MTEQDLTARLKEYAQFLEGCNGIYRGILTETLPQPSPDATPAQIQALVHLQAQVGLTGGAYSNVLRQLYETFPEIRPKLDEKK